MPSTIRDLRWALLRQILGGWGCPVAKTARSYLESFSHNTNVWQTDGQTDGVAVAIKRCKAKLQRSKALSTLATCRRIRRQFVAGNGDKLSPNSTTSRQCGQGLKSCLFVGVYVHQSSLWSQWSCVCDVDMTSFNVQKQRLSSSDDDGSTTPPASQSRDDDDVIDLRVPAGMASRVVDG